MHIHVLYFAALREQRGCPAETVDLPPGTTAGEAYRLLCPPALLPVRCAVNQRFAPETTVLEDGDDLAFLPPLGGG